MCEDTKSLWKWVSLKKSGHISQWIDFGAVIKWKVWVKKIYIKMYSYYLQIVLNGNYYGEVSITIMFSVCDIFWVNLGS